MKPIEFIAKFGGELNTLGLEWISEARELKQKHFIPGSGWDNEKAHTRYATLITCCEQLNKTINGETKK